MKARLTALVLLAQVLAGCSIFEGFDTIQGPDLQDSGDDTSSGDVTVDTAPDTAKETGADTGDSSFVPDASDAGTDSRDSSASGDADGGGDGADTAPPVCTAGTFSCAGASGNELRKCKPDGSGYDAVATCTSAAMCDATGGHCLVCTGGAYQCAGASGNQLQKCRADGTAWDSAATCSSAAACDATGGRCLSCSAGTFACSGAGGNELQKCKTDGTGFDPVSTCTSAALCDAAGGKCLACAPSTYACTGTSGNALQKCKSDGSGYSAVVTCPSAATCDTTLGRCTYCTPGDLSCSGQQLQKCDSYGASTPAFGTACATGTYCDTAGGGRCDPCVKNAFFCIGKNLRQCAPDGTSSSLIESCVTPELCAMSGASGCTAPVCTAGTPKCSGKIVQTCNTGETGYDNTTTCAINCAAGACLTVSEIASGDSNSTCARLNDGTVWCWGDNTNGHMGDGEATPLIRRVPTKVGSVVAAQIVSSNFAAGARLGDGTLVWWGKVPGGSGTIVPTPITGVSSAVDFAMGGYDSCARISDSTVKCWGYNDVGQLADGGSTDHFSPTLIANLFGSTAIALGDNFGCRIWGSTIDCWGVNNVGQGGDGTTSNHPTPTQVKSALGPLTGTFGPVAAGHQAACVLLGGSVKCWGSGPLGNGASEQHLAVDVTGITTATQVAIGSGHACAILADTTVRCWGLNGSGQLGNSSTAPSSTPVTVTGLSGAVQLALGYTHSCARLSDGSVKCWGSNASGQIGDGTPSDRNAPVLVVWP